MKLKIVALFVLLSLLLTACAATQGVAQRVVELPSPLQLAILAGVTFVVGFLFTKIAEAVPFLEKFLGQYVDEVSTAAAGALILAIQNALNAIPPEWEGVANAALALLVAILAAIGLIKTVRKAVYTLALRATLRG
jgi:predicted small secreted protein